MTRPGRYAIVGLGHRHTLYRDALARDFRATSQLVGLCDSNPARLALSMQCAAALGVPAPGYRAADFDRMLAEARPDVVIVVTRDNEHADYICRALEQGCDVITEKPMTADVAQCRRILETRRRTGRNVKVTFNCRYAPPRAQVKDLLMKGVIGDVLAVSFEWLLDVSHGADYFRRWHRNKVNSGGLLVHKATHHFDLVNWWLSAVPAVVQATGRRCFYTPQTADRYGLKHRGERCSGCPEAARCRFHLDLAGNAQLAELYLDAERHDGYFRDRCVFSGDIDIEDNLNVLVDYATGAKLTYTLNAFMPWEGYTVNFNGTRGRLEHRWVESAGAGTGAPSPAGATIRVLPHWQPAYAVEPDEGSGGHGGADPVMLRYLFDPAGQPRDPYRRDADERSGAWSLLIGLAANRSMAEARPVRIAELVDGIGAPDYPPMPSPDAPLA